jgi:mono/diheme cytochrome c family protein
MRERARGIAPAGRARMRIAAVVLFAAACGSGPSGVVDPPPFSPDSGTPFGPQPDFGPTVLQPVAPPAISGGTLAIVPGTKTAVAADPDRDRVFVADVVTGQLHAVVRLSVGDEPGRVLVDGIGRVHVVLRGGGALVTLDPATWSIAARRPVCGAPRDVAWDPTGDLVHVACAGGELVTLPAGGGAATRVVTLERDLHDVVVFGGQIVVSKLRTAELLALDSNGAIAQRATPPQFASFRQFSASGARRLQVGSDGLLYELHQRGAIDTVHQGTPGGYGGSDPCSDPIVHATITTWGPGLVPHVGGVIANAVVPVDLALAHASTQAAIAAPGNTAIASQPNVVIANRTPGDCDGGNDVHYRPLEATAVAFTDDDVLVIQSREPAQLAVFQAVTNSSVTSAPTQTITLSTDTRADTGHAIFHANAGAGVACASCHLEGGDDGRVWQFDGIGGRRTQSLHEGISGTEPFHWDGEEAQFTALVHDVFEGRMAGPTLTPVQLAAAKSWIAALHPPPAPTGDPAAIARGQQLFQGSAGCVVCHSGAKLTNNATVDVGTGGAFQVPSLVGVAWRAPFLHDGRAATLGDRFDPAIGGGDRHGVTSGLTQEQIADLIAYLQTL